MTNKKKVLSLVLVLALVLATIGGTMAWLMDKSGPVVNTFTVGNVDVTLAETTGSNYKMVPGNTINKDPKVTLEEGSETSYLFVEVIRSANYNNYMDTAIDSAWTKLNTGDAREVYYIENVTAPKTYAVLKDNQVKVKDGVTNTMMEEAKKSAPTLTFNAYAVQKEGFANPADAWAEAQKAAKSGK